MTGYCTLVLYFHSPAARKASGCRPVFSFGRHQHVYILIPLPVVQEESTVNNAIFIRNESLFVVSAAATSAFQLEHTPWWRRSICPAGYEIRSIKSSMGKYLSCRSTGNTMDAYTKYIIKCNIMLMHKQMSTRPPFVGGWGGLGTRLQFVESWAMGRHM